MIRSRKELYKYLDTQDLQTKQDTNMSSVYFLVKYEDKTEIVYFSHFEDVYFESPVTVRECEMTIEELREYVKYTYLEGAYEEALAYELTLYRNGRLYEIDCPQCAPWLPDKIDEIEMLSESQCLDLILKWKKMEELKL